MNKKIIKISILLLIILIPLNFTSCKAIQNANNSQKGGVIGATGGAVIGAIIGNNIGKGGNGELGAVIGGVVGGTAGVLVGRKMDKQAQKIENEVPGAEVERIDDAIVVTFDENKGGGVYFDTNKYNINSNSQQTLDKLANVFKEYRDTNILVVGHTDNVGEDSYNMTLSKNRAYAVSNYFINNRGILSSRINVNWFGESKPMADNSSATGRAKNRRVNIVILPNDKMKQDAKKEVNN
jgi:outer membrane protein OmpA-like peptidoglycan-associated protein